MIGEMTDVHGASETCSRFFFEGCHACMAGQFFGVVGVFGKSFGDGDEGNGIDLTHSFDGGDVAILSAEPLIAFD